MHDPQHFREKAVQARRLAAYMTDQQVIENLERLAREYDQIADDLEKGTPAQCS